MGTPASEVGKYAASPGQRADARGDGSEQCRHEGDVQRVGGCCCEDLSAAQPPSVMRQRQLQRQQQPSWCNAALQPTVRQSV